MDRRQQGQAHPAFVEVIKQLTCEEAQLLRSLLHRGTFRPVGELRLEEKKTGKYEILARHVMDLRRQGSPAVVPGLQAMVENWIRLGLVDVDYTISLTDDELYDYLKQRPEYLNPSVIPHMRQQLQWQHGALQVTEFGQGFGRAVGITKHGLI